MNLEEDVLEAPCVDHAIEPGIELLDRSLADTLTHPRRNRSESLLE